MTPEEKTWYNLVEIHWEYVNKNETSSAYPLPPPELLREFTVV